MIFMIDGLIIALRVTNRHSIEPFFVWHVGSVMVAGIKNRAVYREQKSANKLPPSYLKRCAENHLERRSRERSNMTSACGQSFGSSACFGCLINI